MFKNLKDRITEYFNLKYEIIRLELIERLVNVMGYMIFIMLAIFLGFSIILFTGIGLAEWIGDLLGRRYAGYFIMGGVLLVALLIIIWRSKPFISFFANKFVGMLTNSTAQKEAEEIAEEKRKALEENR